MVVAITTYNYVDIVTNPTGWKAFQILRFNYHVSRAKIEILVEILCFILYHIQRGTELMEKEWNYNISSWQASAGYQDRQYSRQPFFSVVTRKES